MSEPRTRLQETEGRMSCRGATQPSVILPDVLRRSLPQWKAESFRGLVMLWKQITPKSQPLRQWVLFFPYAMCVHLVWAGDSVSCHYHFCTSADEADTTWNIANICGSRRERDGPLLTGSWNFPLEITHGISARSSLTKERHMAMSNHKDCASCKPTQPRS